jgi:hypothetical protein
MSKAPWELEGYSEIASAEIDAHGDISVVFQNGDAVTLPPAAAVVPAAVRFNPEEP